MDAITNPYTPGAGVPPPALAGRRDLLDRMRICTERLRVGNPDKSLIMVGLRGVGKTVLLDQMRSQANARGAHTLRIEVQEGKSLPAMLAPQLRLAMLKLSQIEAAKAFAQRGLRALAGFAKALKVKFNDIEVGLDYEPEQGLADNGDLESDLTALLVQAGHAAKAAATVMVIFIDELQYVPQDQLRALIGALHSCAHERLPITMVGAGLPQLVGQAGNAKSYAERLFEYPHVGRLSDAAAHEALSKPAEQLGVHYTEAAVQAIIDRTQGYPYFIQEWGKHAWLAAEHSPITQDDVEKATVMAIATLDESFFKVRLERTTPSERRYLQAMALLGAGPHRTGDIAQKLDKKTNLLGPVRQSLISKGMIWSPAHGDTAFTVPLFHDYLQRAL